MIYQLLLRAQNSEQELDKAVTLDPLACEERDRLVGSSNIRSIANPERGKFLNNSNIAKLKHSKRERDTKKKENLYLLIQGLERTFDLQLT